MLLLQFLNLLLLFILPFVVFPLANQYFEPPKVLISELLIELILLCSFFNLNKKLLLKQLDLKSFLLIGILLVLAIFSSIKDHASINFFGNSYRLQGPFLLIHLYLFSLITAAVSKLKLPKISHSVLLWLLVGMGLLTQWVGITKNDRMVGTLGEPNTFAALVVVFLLFALFDSKRYLHLLDIALALTGVWLSGSRSGVIALVMVILAYLLDLKKVSLSVITIILTVIFGLSLLLPQVEKSEGIDNRLEIWRVSLAAPTENIFLGMGFGRIEQSIKLSSEKLDSVIKYQRVDSAHNIFLDYWIQGGLLGAVAFTALIISVLINLLKNKLVVETVCLFVTMTMLSFNPLGVSTLIFFWWTIGRGMRQ